jgi:putative dimethyl sulfoxide reductase chaperone
MVVETKPDAATAAFSKLAFIAMARANIFRLLTLAFYDPTQDFVQQLASGSYVSELHGYYSDMVSHYHIGVDALTPLKDYQSGLSEHDLAELLKGMKVEYARLFIGPGIPVVQPYETFYDEKLKNTSQPLLMVSPSAIAVENAYLEAGLAVAENKRTPPDHFAVELEFLYYLSKKESDAWAESDNTAAKKWRRRELAFIDGHLGCWGQRFCSKVQKESFHPFYRSITFFAGTLLKLEGSSTAVHCGDKTPVAVENT